MPTLDFKGKQHIYAHHLTVPYRPLVADPARSVAHTPPPRIFVLHLSRMIISSSTGTTSTR